MTPGYSASRFSTATTVLKRFPVTLVPFALLTSVLVQGSTKKGWVELFAKDGLGGKGYGSGWRHCRHGHRCLYLV
jgi:hypothetical protein